jgi:hypothetical protein
MESQGFLSVLLVSHPNLGPLACVAGLFGGGSMVAGGTVLLKFGYNHMTTEVSEGIKQATCSEVP